MMDANDLRRARDESLAPYQEFQKHIRENKEGLFCFFEGKDSPYYYPRIKQFTALTIFPIKCHGRKFVLKLYELISYHQEYKKYEKAFFIDRDFNQPLKNSDIFETPCYSIENFYTSIDTFKEIVKNSLGLSEVSNAYQICLTLYTQRQIEFHQATLLFNAWYACLIFLRNTTNIEIGVNLSDKLGGDKPTKNFINFTLESVSANYTFQTIQQNFPNAPIVPSDSLSQKVKDFSECEQHKVFRGKYEMQFVVVMIDLLWQDSNKHHKYFKENEEKITFSFSSKLSNEQAIELFSNYAETPDCLITYLEKFK